MSPAGATNNVPVGEREAEAAVSEFIEMRAAILGRLPQEALRCRSGHLRAAYGREKKKRRTRVSDLSVTTELSEAPSRRLDMLL